MTTFLPKGYKAPEGSSTFMKLQEGANRFRIMSDAVIGWEGWKDNKPFRREGAEINITADEVDTDQKYKKPKISHFWAFKVYDYTDGSVKILEITQKTIMKAIQALVEDDDWGDPKNYDISITRTKEGERTSYSVKSYPPKAISPDIEEAVEASELDPMDLFKDVQDDEAEGLPVKKPVKAGARKSKDF